MKVLMVTPYLPYPPSSGGQVRSYNLIKHLAAHHEITLFSLVKNEAEKKYISHIKQYCIKVAVFRRPENPWTLSNILHTGLGRYPFLVVRNLSSEQKNALKLELENNQFDLIHAETFYVMPHIPETDIPILLVDQTIEYKVYQHFVEQIHFWPLKPILYIDLVKLKYWEKYYWQKAALVVAVSEDDKGKINAIVPSLTIEVIPNGVDINFFAGRKKKGNSPKILFQGNFTWLQNVEAARILVNQVFPLIKRKFPTAQCIISGQFPKLNIKQLEQIDGVEVRELVAGDVESVRGIYQEATVLVAPLYGPGGTRLKILAAMAARVPVVTTSIGASGIEATDGREILIRDTPHAIAQATISLLRADDLYQKLTRAARQLVEKKYSWVTIAHKLDQLYRKVGRFKGAKLPLRI